MWPDNETDRDFLNFEGVADTIAEMIVQAQGRPISIGVSGAWGVGKSSMIKLTRASMVKHQPKTGASKYLFVEFNAWLYQGYDDARAALLEVIASTLSEEAEKRSSGVDRARDFLARVRWLRLAKLVALPAASVALGLPPIGLPGEITALVQDGLDNGIAEKELEEAGALASATAAATAGLLKPRKDSSPPREIQALRDSFEELLDEVGVTLVVLIDDLDRCMPDTTIATLEAIRLFLFLQNTAFVIAADDAMIKHAVRKHFDGLEDDRLVTNYFDKLIQVPIRVPALGIQEVRAYMMMLFIENSGLDLVDQDKLRSAVAGQLRESWKGKRVDRTFVETCGVTLPPALVARLDTAERLAPLMTTAERISGNPRLVKRFLNALAIRMAMARSQGIDLDEAVLAKLLLFERLAPPGAFVQLAASVNLDPDGRPRLLMPLEAAAVSGDTPELIGPWDDDFVREWLALSPPLADQDLRGALYVGREHAPLVTSEDRLSSGAATMLAALLENPGEAAALADGLGALPRAELKTMLDRLVARARQESKWGAPPILGACIVVAGADGSRQATLAGFLIERPATQIQASIVPKLASLPWAAAVLDYWHDSPDISGPVRKAIENRGTSGNVTK